jgi:hypothetical protein
VVALESAELKGERPMPHQPHPARVTCNAVIICTIRSLNGQSGVVCVFYHRRDGTPLAARVLRHCLLYGQALGLPFAVHAHLEVTKTTAETGLAIIAGTRCDCRPRAVVDRKAATVRGSLAVIERATCDRSVRIARVRSLKP